MSRHAVPEQDVEQRHATPSLYAIKTVYRENTIAVLWVTIGVLVFVIFILSAWTRGIYVEAMRHAPVIVGVTAEGEARILPAETVSFRPADMLGTVRTQLRHWADQYYSRVPSGRLAYDTARQFTDTSRIATEQEKVKAHLEIDAVSKHERDSTVVVSSIVSFPTAYMKQMQQLGCPETPGKRCHAEIDAERYTLGANGETSKAAKLKIAIEFCKLDTVPAELLAENPLGIIVTDVLVTEALQ
jgi:hypothetical protein